MAWPSATSARPDMISVAALPILASPAANIGLLVSAPPEGLILTSSPRPRACRRMISWWVNCACSSATWAPAAPAACPALAERIGAVYFPMAQMSAGQLGRLVIRLRARR